MPIYEYYCPDNHRVYQFYAKTIAQGKTTPKCPDHPDYRMVKMLSAFAVKTGGKSAETQDPSAEVPQSGTKGEDAAIAAMESEFSHVDENDPRAMGRMMRRMAELTGEKIDGEMEEVVRKLEEGTDPEALEEQLGGDAPADDESPGGGRGDEGEAKDAPGPGPRFRVRRGPPARDPKLYDYE